MYEDLAQFGVGSAGIAKAETRADRVCWWGWVRGTSTSGQPPRIPRHTGVSEDLALPTTGPCSDKATR